MLVTIVGVGSLVTLSACGAAESATSAQMTTSPTPSARVTAVSTLSTVVPGPLNLTPGGCSHARTVDLAETSSPGDYRACVAVGSTVVVRLAAPRVGSWAPLTSADPAAVQVEQAPKDDKSVSVVLHPASSGLTSITTHTVVPDGLGMPEQPWKLELEAT